jgi:hypothetical protein
MAVIPSQDADQCGIANVAEQVVRAKVVAPLTGTGHVSSTTEALKRAHHARRGPASTSEISPRRQGSRTGASAARLQVFENIDGVEVAGVEDELDAGEELQAAIR